MSITKLQTNGRISIQPNNGIKVQVLTSISNRLMSEAICSVISSNETYAARRGDLHRLDLHDLKNYLEQSANLIHVIDLDSLEQLERQVDCSTLLKTAVVLAHPNELMLNGFTRTDIVGLVSWESAATGLFQAINAVGIGQKYVDPLLLKTIEDIHRNGATILTNRQMQILRMVADGDSSREIAAKLHLSRRTVENHRARILERLRVGSAAEMLEVARRNNWI